MDGPDSYGVAVATDITRASAAQRRQLVVALQQWRPQVSTRAGRLVVGLQVRDADELAAGKQARAMVGRLLREIGAAGKVTAVDVVAGGRS